MDTRGFWLCLLVLLSLIDLSKQGCRDYFSLKNRGKYADHNVSIVNTKDPKDTWECAVERGCLNVMKECTKSVMSDCQKSKPSYCDWLVHCFNRMNYPTNVTEKCEGEVSQKLNGYHLVCLTAKHLNHSAEDCDYEPVCELFPNTQPTVSVETTTLPPPTTTTKATLPETTTTTEAATTTTLPDTTRATTTTATTTATTTTTTTATTTTTSTTALSPTVTQTAVSGNNAHQSQTKDSSNILLGVSVIFNVIVPLAVYLYMRHRWMQDRKQLMSALESNGHLPEAQPMTELRCQSVVTHCADTDSDCCAAGEDTPL